MWLVCMDYDYDFFAVSVVVSESIMYARIFNSEHYKTKWIEYQPHQVFLIYGNQGTCYSYSEIGYVKTDATQLWFWPPDTRYNQTTHTDNCLSGMFMLRVRETRANQ